MTEYTVPGPLREQLLARANLIFKNYPVELSSTTLSTPNAKWRAISALQKAIRRKDVAATRRMGSALINSGESGYLLRRMCVVALEDVAFGDIELCALVMAFSGDPTFRTELGHSENHEDILTMLVALANADADRTPCEISVTASYTPLANDLKLELIELSKTDVDTLWKRALSAPPPTRHLAARAFGGTLKAINEDGKEIKSKGNKGLFFALSEFDPDYIQMMCTIGLRFGGELVGLSTGTRLTYEIMEKEKHQFLSTHEVPPQVSTCKGIDVAAFDMHTYEGKRCFQRFLAKCPEFKEYVRDHGGDPAAALGNAVFIVDGKICLDRRITPTGRIYRERSHHAQMEASGLTGEHTDDVCNILLKNWHLMQEIRATAIT